MKRINSEQFNFFKKVASTLFIFFQIVFSHSALSNPSNTQFTVEIPNTSWWLAVANNQANKVPPLNSIARTADLETLARVRGRMKKMAQFDFTIAISSSDTINAYAKHQNGMNLIILTSGFIHKFGNDSDAIATTIGHELAHHYYGHAGHDHEINAYAPNSTTHALQSLGELVNKNTSESSVAITQADAYKDSRNQEQAADLFGMFLATQAGYSAFGVYKLAQGLQELQRNWQYLPTHPSNAERMDAAQKYVEDNAHSKYTADFRFVMDSNSKTYLSRTKHASQLVQISNEGGTEEFEIH